MADKSSKRAGSESKSLKTRLRKGDPVMVVAGGNAKKNRVLKGQTGKILRFIPKKDRAVVEGLNIIKRHKRATMMNEASGVIEREGSVHISNLMYYSEELKRPVRLKVKRLEDGRKVRGFVHPETKQFEQLDV